MADQKINALEEMLAHQEQRILDLSDMVTQQWKEIDFLKARLNQLLNKVVDMGQGSDSAQGEPLSAIEIALRDKPPHY